MRRRTRGHAVVELALLMPWLFFLFVGAIDFGFYSYALISVQNAARVAALNAGGSKAAASSAPDACFHVRRELSRMPNAASFPVTCSAEPLVVTVTPFQDADNMSATRVRVTYRTVQMIPIPGLLSGRPTISRAVETKVFGE